MPEQISPLMASKQALIEAAKLAAMPALDSIEHEQRMMDVDILLHTASVNALIASAEAQVAGVALLSDIVATLGGLIDTVEAKH